MLKFIGNKDKFSFENNVWIVIVEKDYKYTWWTFRIYINKKHWLGTEIVKEVHKIWILSEAKHRSSNLFRDILENNKK